MASAATASSSSTSNSSSSSSSSSSGTTNTGLGLAGNSNNNNTRGETLRRKDKERDVRSSNIIAARAVADTVRTSLGPKGMDKMITTSGSKDVVITNDGATILGKMKLQHPCAKMMQELSKSQDVEAGDGTTTVVVIAGSLLSYCENLLAKGIHPSMIADSFLLASHKALEVLEQTAAQPVNLADREALLSAATTSLSSKVVSPDSVRLAPIAVDATLRVIDPETAVNVDVNSSIKVVERVGGTVDETQLVDGLVLKGCATNGGPTSIKDAKIGLIQFHLSAPKTDMENEIAVSEYAHMDRILREERKHIMKLVKKIKAAGCNVLLVQKSILRDATNELSLHYLNKMGIMVITDIERNDVEFICRTVGCTPVAHVDSFVPEKLGKAELAEEVHLEAGGRVTKITGVENPGRTVTVLVRGSNKLVLEEAGRSLHDALCVVRSLVKKRFMIVGGAAPEAELAWRLSEFSRTLFGPKQFCVKAFADALEIIPYTLAENAGLNPIEVVTELRRMHAEGCSTAGIDVKQGKVTDLANSGVLQPLLVTTSSIALASETVGMIMKIDDLLGTM